MDSRIPIGFDTETHLFAPGNMAPPIVCVSEASNELGVHLYDRAGGLYISILTNPTMGGVAASFALQGDIQLAEPGALIGFAGKRTIYQTIRLELPEGFQTAEFLLKHGFIDRIVPRKDLRTEVARLIDYCEH